MRPDELAEKADQIRKGTYVEQSGESQQPIKRSYTVKPTQESDLQSVMDTS